MGVEGAVNEKSLLILFHDDRIFYFLCFHPKAVEHMKNLDRSGFSPQTRNQKKWR